MSPKEKFNPMSALTAILDKHKGPVDPATMQQYISFVSFMSLSQMYQAFAPPPSINPAANATNDISHMLNNMMSGSEPKGSDKMNNLTSLLNDKQGISSLLASIPPEKMSQIASMLGGQGSMPGPSAGNLNSLLSGSGGSPDLSSLISSISKKGGMMPLLSMLGGGGGGGLSSLLPLLGGKGGGNPLLSMLGGGLGGGGAAPLMSMLGGLGGGKGGGLPFLSALGGGFGGGGAAPLMSMLGGLGGGKGGGLPFLSALGGKGKGGLGGFMSQLGKNPALASMASYAPLLFLFGGSGMNIFKGKRSKRSRRSKTPSLSQDQLNSLFGNNPQMKHLIPLFTNLQSSGMKNMDFSKLAPYLLPVAAQYQKQLKNKKASTALQTKPAQTQSDTSMTFTQYAQNPVDFTQQVQFSPVKITPQKTVSFQQQKQSMQIPIKTN